MTRTLLAAGFLLLSLPAFVRANPPLTPPDVLGAAKTIQFTATLYRNAVPSGSFLADKSNDKAARVSNAMLVQPNKACVVDMDAKTKAVEVVYVSDGKIQTEYRASRQHYTKSETPARISDMDSRTLALSTLTDFYDAKAFARFSDLGAIGLNEKPQNHAYRFLLGTENGKQSYEYVLVNHKTGLPLFVSVAIDVTERDDWGPGTHLEQRETERIVFTHWKLNAPIDEAKFAYTPPAEAKLYTPPALLANGTAAPDFTVQDKDGKPVKLSDYKGKTVVLDFWATWCGPCQSSLPHTTEMAKKYAAKNVVVLAVNVWDSKAAFDTWLPKHPEYAPLHFAIDPNPDQSKSVASALYGVSGIPTQYVVGPDGRIKKSIVGYDEGSPELEEALK